MVMNESMGNVNPIRNESDSTRLARAGFVQSALKAERWSTRQAALALGISHSALGSRFRAETAFLADELESIAHLLKRDPVEFYAEYVVVGPTGIEPMTSTVEYTHLADVLPFTRHAVGE